MAKSAWHLYELEETVYHPPMLDAEPDAEGNLPLDETYYWRIKAPSFATERKVASLLSKPGGTLADVMRTEIAYTFGGTNFPAPESPTVNPSEDGFVAALKDDAKPEAVMAFLDRLPPHYVGDIWNEIKKVAPNWGPKFQG